jgi:hypothetical protein
MTTTAKPQLSLDETIVEDAELEAALEARERAKQKAATARKAFQDADESARGRIRELEVGADPVRVGRFVILERPVAARSVSFEAGATARLTIRADPSE